jgi:hypothetical protein
MSAAFPRASWPLRTSTRPVDVPARRHLRALELVEERERKSLEIALLKERRVEERERTEHQPEPEPTRSHPDEFNLAAKKPIDLKTEFERASGSAGDEGEAAGGAIQEPAPEAEITIQRRKRTRERSEEPERSALFGHLG